MNSNPTLAARTVVVAGTLLLALAVSTGRAQALAPVSGSAARPASPAGAVVELSPFEVRTDKDEGFVATSSLAGGRLATDLRDTPAAYSVITREFIDALDLIDLQSVAEWTTGSTEIPHVGDATFFTFSTYYSTRGTRAGTQQRNFFPQYGDQDTFDIERFDFGRGPNSILFGNGTLGGTSSSTTKRARVDRAFADAQLSVGSWNTYRATLDVNRPITKQVALRTAAVWGDGDGWRDKNFNRRKGAFATTTFRPFRHTEIRLEGEYLEIQKQTGFSLLTDHLSGWNGALTYNTPVALRTATTAVLNAATAAGVNRRGSNYHVFDPYNGMNAIVNLQGEPVTRGGGETATTPIAGFTYGASGGGTFNTSDAPLSHASGLPANRFDTALASSRFWVPGDAFTISPDAPLLSSRFKDLQLTINQRLGDFHFEAAADINRQAYFVNGEENRDTRDAYIDINRVLPNGAPNPHFLEPYGDGSYFRGFRNYNFENFRVAAAYVKNTRFVVNTMAGSNDNHYTLSYRWLSLAQGADRSQWIQTAQFIRVRRYWRETNRPILDLSLNPLRFLDPGVTDTQIQPRWVIDNSRYDTETINDAKYKYALTALNAKFLRDRLVLLGAVRRDQFYSASQQQVRRGDYPENFDPTTALFRPSAPTDWATLTYVPKDTAGRPTGPEQPALTRPRAPSAGNFRPLPQYANDRFQDDYNAPPLEGYQTTKSMGAVFHLTRWLSPFFNYAETFNPAAAYNVLLDANLVPPTVSKGRDYGTRVELLQGRLNLSLSYYENEEINRAASLSRPPINTLYRATPQGSTEDLNRRGQTPLPSTYYDLSARHGIGYEIEATANLAKGLRLSASFALPKVYLDDANAMTRAYIDSHGEAFKQIAQDANALVDPNTNVARVDTSVPAAIRSPDAQAAADAYNGIYQWRASQTEGRILDQKQKLVKLFADYTLPAGRLKGLRVGLGVRYDGRRIVGDRANDTMRNPANPTQAIDDPDRTLYTLIYTPKGLYTATATLGYSFKLFARSVQANLVVNNLFNDRSVTYLGTALRPRDGDYTSPARESVLNTYSLKQPLSFNLRLGVKL
jgi:outer membrane receptor protein involved in Fe transport